MGKKRSEIILNMLKVTGSNITQVIEREDPAEIFALLVNLEGVIGSYVEAAYKNIPRSRRKELGL